MDIEFIKFYETQRDDRREHLIGSLHIRLPELCLNIKGIHVLRKKNYWFVGLPDRRGWDKSLDKEVIYSVILFDSKKMNDELIGILREKGRAFVEDYLKSNPQRAEGRGVVAPTKECDISTAPKETVSSAKLKQKIWRDPPPMQRRIPPTRSSNGNRR